MNEDFPPFIFSKTLADKLSTWLVFHSCHLFLFNIRHFTKIRSCIKRNSRFETAWSNAMIHEPIVGSSSGFPLLNQSRSANSHTWLLSCWHNKESLFILLWRRWFEFRSRFSVHYRLFYELQSTFFSHSNYVERIMLCRKENSVQIARLVILGADRRSRLRCQRWQSFWWVHRLLAVCFSLEYGSRVARA